MHSYHVFTDAKDWEPFKEPYLAAGGTWPAAGCAVMFAELDEQGNPVACQFLQNALFAEGMWATRGAHLRTLNNNLIKYVKEVLGASGSLFTMTRDDETGNRIGKAAQYMGYEPLAWKIYRREI